MKILILYYELAYYNLPCFKELSKNNEIFLVKYEINKLEAPFKFKFDFPLKLYDANLLSYKDLLGIYSEICPDIIFCAGWVNKDYLRLCSENTNQINILGFDTTWDNNILQNLKALLYKLKYRNVFNYAFVPGLKQFELAQKMGFKKNKIKLGAYSCDFNYFKKLGDSYNKLKKNNNPKRFLFVGRYIKRKGILDLWNSFLQLNNEVSNNWELWCVGTGPLYEKRIVHPKIKHFGFLQPSEIKLLIKDTSVFILPSHFEPWGVVVHEFASAGFPLILSDKISSSTSFLDNNVNGFMFQSKSIPSLKNALKKMIRTNDENLYKMGQISVKLASTITPEKWAKQILDD